MIAVALWYLKKEITPKYSGRTQGPDILPPLTEDVKGGPVHIEPGEFDTEGRPSRIHIEKLMESGYATIQGRINDFREFIFEDGTDDKKQLMAMKKGLKRAKKKMMKRQKSLHGHG